MKGWHKHGVCAERVHWRYTGKQDRDALRGARSRTRCSGRSAPTSASTTRTSSPCTRRSPRSASSTRPRRSTRAGTPWAPTALIECEPTARRCWAATRLRSSAYDERRVLDPELVGRRTGATAGSARSPTTTGWPTARDVWVGAPRRADRLARRATAVAARHRRRVAKDRALRVLRPAPAHHQPRQRRAAAHRWHLRHDPPRTSSAIFTRTSRGSHCRPADVSAAPVRAWRPRRRRTRAVQRVADYARPVARRRASIRSSFIWKTDFWTRSPTSSRTRCAKRRPEGFLDATKDFMLDRLDDALEPLARADRWQGAVERDEGERDARQRCAEAARRASSRSRSSRPAYPALEIHIVGHSAGSILLGGRWRR